jgi:hypothetical protein
LPILRGCSSSLKDRSPTFLLSASVRSVLEKKARMQIQQFDVDQAAARLPRARRDECGWRCALSCGLRLLVALRLAIPLRRLGRTTHDALDHYGRDAREYGLGHRGSQDVGDRT